MVRRILDFALYQRFVTLALGFALVMLGTVAFQRLPLEGCPDVGDVEVDVITIWSGRAAEEVERYLTIPLEQELNGIATFGRRTVLAACWLSVGTRASVGSRCFFSPSPSGICRGGS